MDKQTKKEFENLAGMIKRGFDNAATKPDIARLEKRIDGLEHGQEEIKLRLDNVAYRFELVELQRRVEILEKRAGIRQK